MALFRPAFAILLALFGSIADAGPQGVPRKYQASFYLDGCKDFLAGRSNFLSGRCVGLLRFLVNWARTINCFVSRTPLATLSKCASS